MFKTIEWTAEGVRMIDQTRLPGEEIYLTYTDYREVAEAIRSMVIRGAPAIGVAAAMGVALGVKHSDAKNVAELRVGLRVIADTLAKTRPTAVNLFWAIKRMRDVFENSLSAATRTPSCSTQCALTGGRSQAHPGGGHRHQRSHGPPRRGPDAGLRNRLTHCNAGALATGGYGTALGVIRAAVGAGKKLTFSPMRRGLFCKARA